MHGLAGGQHRSSTHRSVSSLCAEVLTLGHALAILKGRCSARPAGQGPYPVVPRGYAGLVQRDERAYAEQRPDQMAQPRDLVLAAGWRQELPADVLTLIDNTNNTNATRGLLGARSCWEAWP
ncbi:DUF6682 family protein [Delftia acidovorans]|uniref:DUF6682 family protein n=1 Tax=Delftia acidovorans TaxID=80866 RepID=UPI00384CB19D